jgi:hypothetical protein
MPFVKKGSRSFSMFFHSFTRIEYVLLVDLVRKKRAQGMEEIPQHLTVKSTFESFKNFSTPMTPR